MATHYVRIFSFKDSLTDSQVLEEWAFFFDDCVPAMKKVAGIKDIKVYAGAGALRANLTVTIDMDDAGVYERLLADPSIRPLVRRLYGSWDMKTATQSFRREITPQLIQALSSSG